MHNEFEDDIAEKGGCPVIEKNVKKRTKSVTYLESVRPTINSLRSPIAHNFNFTMEFVNILGLDSMITQSSVVISEMYEGLP
jgi:hypothetical protein